MGPGRPLRSGTTSKCALLIVATAAMACHGGGAQQTQLATARKQPRAEAPGRVTLDGAQIAQIDAILATQQRAQHIPGLSFAVVKDGEVVYLRALGLRDIERKLPATVDTLFPIGSCTKAFTSMAVAIAADEGLLALGDPPRKVLPYFRMADADADARVTLRDMLGHRSGLKPKADLAAEPGVLTREEFVRAATSAKPVAKLGTFTYSNAMYSAAGEIVGAVYHSTWEKVIETKIFRPLGMTSSKASLADIAAAPDHATGYAYAAGNNTWQAVPPPTSLAALAPGGSIASTARDMTRWLRMLTGGGRIGAERLVSDAMLHELTTPQVRIDESKSYALGWATYDWAGVGVVEHNGGSTGISALVSFIPARRVGFVLLANTSPNFMTAIGNAGKLLWPVILQGEMPGEARGPTTAISPEAAPAAPDAAPTTTGASPSNAEAANLPSVQALLARMIQAKGGERTLRRHVSLTLRARKSYDNQGVTAMLTVYAKAPNMRSEQELWSAAGKEIARLRIYFDGAHGGQETTFGQDAINDDEANARARRDNDLHPLLHLERLYEGTRLRARATTGGEEVYILELTPSRGAPTRLYVSVKSALVVRRETAGEAAAYGDYRPVDGELVPFRTTVEDALGETTIQVEEAQFNVAPPDAAFASAKAAP